jgi:hypothetical protein
MHVISDVRSGWIGLIDRLNRIIGLKTAEEVYRHTISHAARSGYDHNTRDNM